MNNKSFTVLAITIVILTTIGLAVVPLLKQVSADRDLKSKTYESEDGSVQRTIGCTKDTGGCKNFNEGFGDNINKAAKEFCESDSGQKCKQSK
ncbi:hypothetical protein [Candidatus Nitrosocosmicus sp. R]